jgi:ketosteroid isomerase-like protein
MSSKLEASSIHTWLEGFSQAVRDRDFKAGRSFFSDDVVGFGSAAKRCDGLHSLEENQWRQVWSVTTGFKFDLASVASGGKGDMAWAACSWQSFGTMPNGEPLLRRGRSSFVLRKQDGRWLAVHSHFSLMPSA